MRKLYHNGFDVSGGLEQSGSFAYVAVGVPFEAEVMIVAGGGGGGRAGATRRRPGDLPALGRRPGHGHLAHGGACGECHRDAQAHAHVHQRLPAAGPGQRE